jgi:monovalent cation:H+ antiporter, CPA1 family
MFEVAVICLVLTALFAYINHRYVGLPTTIGVMGIAQVFSFVLFGLGALGIGSFHQYEVSLLSSINFSDVLMEGMLSLLLFAGALHVDLSELKEYGWQILVLAVIGTVLSTIFVAVGLWYLLPLTGYTLPFAYCLVFGALISPTDPIAVMGIMKSAGAPKSLELLITGESLFNDGVGVVIFSLVLSMITSGESPTFIHGAELLAHEAGGGILFGLVLGAVTFYLLKSIESYMEEVLITIAAVLGGYALAMHLHVSGPLAMVIVGLIIGNHGREHAMEDETREYLDMFWELLDAILNSVLFVLIGLEVIVISFSASLFLAIFPVIVLCLLARLTTVGLPTGMLRKAFKIPRGSWQILTWGGLRGGISVALALSLPTGPERDLVLALTYSIVVFSILVQGLSIGKVITRNVPKA